VANQAKPTDRNNRRAFLCGLAAAAVVPALPAIPATAWGAILAPGKAAGRQTPSSPSPEVAALTELVRLRYGKYLEDRDMPVLRRGLERIPRSAAEVLKVRITNNDPPDCLFIPDGL
jgi:hypothetical protein